MTTSRPARLQSSVGELAAGYGLSLLDLDGVIYLLDQAIPGAEETVRRLREINNQPVFVTNNASRRSHEVANALTGMGIGARADEVQTSAQTAARLIAERFAESDPAVLVTGSEALKAEIQDLGLRTTTEARQAEVVVQGYAADLGWRDLASAAVAVRRGAYWVATNTDATLPSPDGPLPGNGSLLKAVEMAVGHGPHLIAGKPEPVIYQQAMNRRPEAAAIAVGDRWDTDIAGANAAGIDSLLVFTGVLNEQQALRLPPEGRPTHLGESVADLFTAHPELKWVDQWLVRCGGWEASIGAGRELVLTGGGTQLDSWRALCELAWAAHDAGVADVDKPVSTT
ncbi:HAD-IIA family hydrolase [Natronoglycomyces albus]|uniref:HAD-IIA family hydrolase n=1 Tax=Natronoglycomyces albus TaxID=2811108 RepID=A0A895XGD6_9ACTN|nr:HAD-IIA family hydrolase [Natronoglycomyces albus]QSB03927.1 HAD-IIA family hydrolase [Natronoglycomyces albus]